jgi:hypothetical protein
MDALTRETEHVSDALQRDALRAKGHDLAVAFDVSRWAGGEWSPLPSRNYGEDFGSLCRQQARALALANVSNPCSEVEDSPVGHCFVVRCRDSRVTGALDVSV